MLHTKERGPVGMALSVSSVNDLQIVESIRIRVLTSGRISPVGVFGLVAQADRGIERPDHRKLRKQEPRMGVS